MPGKAKLFLEKELKQYSQNAVDLVHIYSDKTGNTMKFEAIFIYLIHAVLL